ncbi:MAG: thioesterase, partial [Pseudodonghicola sp.]
MTLAMTRDELSDYLHEVFPQIRDDFRIDALTPQSVTMRLLTAVRHLRPGGTVSGPSMFALADVAVYAMVLARVGRQALA